MPSIIDYSAALDRLLSLGMVCNYHNSGSFALRPGTDVIYRGWIGPEDSTIRPAFRDVVRSVPLPHARNLAEGLRQVWLTRLPGPVWIMPASHWAFEMDFGSGTWLPGLLGQIGIDPGLLKGLNTAAPIEFAPAEAGAATQFAAGLLQNLTGSEFTAAFPEHKALCILHHHTQIWWMCENPELIAAIDAALAAMRPTES
jgi:hypothetical protein